MYHWSLFYGGGLLALHYEMATTALRCEGPLQLEEADRAAEDLLLASEEDLLSVPRLLKTENVKQGRGTWNSEGVFPNMLMGNV